MLVSELKKIGYYEEKLKRYIFDYFDSISIHFFIEFQNCSSKNNLERIKEFTK